MHRARSRKEEIRVGDTFTRLKVLSYVGTRPHVGHIWKVQCICGRIREARGTRLLSRVTKSCGCLAAELSSIRRKQDIKHGDGRNTGKASEYSTWCSLKHRCLNPNNASFHNYGGRGISVHHTWRDSYEQFLTDVGRRPSNKHTLERIDNDGDYAPDNVRWATRLEQAQNTRKVTLVTYQGRTQTASQWAREVGLKATTVNQRIKRGWTPERALTEPLKVVYH
jgi:hypothetical protein